MARRRLLFSFSAALLVLSACSSDTGNQSSPTVRSATTLGGGDSSDGSESATPNTTPPIILEIRQGLALLAGQCYAEAPPPPSTTSAPTTVIFVTDESGVPVTDAAGSVLTESPPTTLPESEPVAVVDCAGSRLGQVYANSCLGVNDLEARVPVEEAPCPGVFEHAYPGSRQLSVAAAKYCLGRFEEALGESYATSDLIAAEWVPTAELWAIGDRRMVCVATPPSP